MALKLSELIAQYGDDDVTFQNLDQCFESANLTKDGTKATFVTPERINPDGFPKLGLIVWLDRERVKEIVAKSKQDPAHG